MERTLGLYGALVVIDPRNAWRLSPGGAEFERQWLWLCHDVEPNWARIASSGSPTAGAVRTGQLMRMVNAGIADHQLHYHGNHVWTLRANGWRHVSRRSAGRLGTRHGTRP